MGRVSVGLRPCPPSNSFGIPATFWRLFAGKGTLFATGAGGYSGRLIGVDWEFFAGRSAVDSVSVEPIGPGASCDGPMSSPLLQPARSAPAMISDAARAGMFRFMLSCPSLRPGYGTQTSPAGSSLSLTHNCSCCRRLSSSPRLCQFLHTSTMTYSLHL